MQDFKLPDVEEHGVYILCNSHRIHSIPLCTSHGIRFGVYKDKNKIRVTEFQETYILGGSWVTQWNLEMGGPRLKSGLRLFLAM